MLDPHWLVTAAACVVHHATLQLPAPGQGIMCHVNVNVDRKFGIGPKADLLSPRTYEVLSDFVQLVRGRACGLGGGLGRISERKIINSYSAFGKAVKTRI